MSIDHIQSIKNAALALHGTTAVVHLLGGQTLTGSLTYVLASPNGPHTTNPYPLALTLTVSTKVYTIRLDHVSALGQS